MIVMRLACMAQPCAIHSLFLPVTVCILNEVHMQTAYPDSELDSQQPAYHTK